MVTKPKHKMSDALAKLQEVKVEPSLKKFQNGAVGSIEMLSVGFYGIIEAFKDEMEKSRDIEDKIEKSVEDICSLKEELKSCNTKCIELNDKLTDEMKKIRKFLASQSSDIDKRLNTIKETLNARCDLVKKECIEAVETVTNKVGKSIENVDRLKQDFENLEQETNDQIRNLSVRCDENKELIEEQDNKFKDQLNELTQILHDKALSLDTKIENCLNETANQIQAFDEKQQLFKFETNKELSQKADVEDLKHKLDISKYEEFMQNIYHQFTEKINENIKIIETNIDNQQSKQSEIDENIQSIKSTQDTFKTFIDDKLNELQTMINNPVDVDSIKQEITQQVVEDQANFREEVISMIQQSANSGGLGQTPAFGTKSGNCIACGRGPSTFQPLPCKSPSPQKKPKHGGGFSRLSSRRKSMDVTRRLLKSCDSQEKLGLNETNNADGVTSPKSARRRKSTSYLSDTSKLNQVKTQKTIIENDPVRVKIPDVNDE